MYCSGCGTELESGLNYCKRCGNRVAGEQRSAVAENLSSALGYIGGFGLLGFIPVIFLMLRSPIISPGTIMLVSFFYLATLLAICFLILRQTAPFTLGKISSTPSRDGGSGAPAYFPPPETARLNESTHDPAGITEQTTRSLDEVPVGRK